MKRQEYRDRIIKTLNFEQQIFKEFEQLCKEEKVYPSQKIQELMLDELQKKVVGQNPLNVLYGIEKEKPLQLELDRWMQHVSMLDNHNQLSILKGRMLAITKQIDRRSMELYRSGIRQ